MTSYGSDYDWHCELDRGYDHDEDYDVHGHHHEHDSPSLNQSMPYACMDG